MVINEYLIQLMRIIKEMEGLDLFADTAKLSKTEFRMIREILLEREKGKNIISSELARRLGITRSAVSQIVTKLEKKGIVKRVGATDDKKIAYVQLSDRSLSLFQDQCDSANAIMDRVAEILGKDKMNELVGLYGEFCTALVAARKEISEKVNSSDLK